MKSVILGLLISVIGITSVFAAESIKSATFSNTTVTLDDTPLNLKDSLVAIVKDNEQNTSLYIPARELLKNLGYQVIWNSSKNSIDLISPEPRIVIEGNTIIKNEDIKIGYGPYVVDLEESLQSGVTWKCTDKSTAVQLEKEEYIGTSESEMSSKRTHRFLFNVSDSNYFQTSESRNLTITFEQMLGDKKLDNKITYNLYVSLSD